MGRGLQDEKCGFWRVGVERCPPIVRRVMMSHTIHPLTYFTILAKPNECFF